MKYLKDSPINRPLYILKYISLIFGLMVVSAPMIMGQAGPLKAIEAMPRETIALQTDRSIYIAGEHVWFRADYFAEGYHPEPPISKVLYLELFNDDEEPVVQKKVALEKGKATGNFVLPKEATSGTYLLRAYTRYQRNFPSEGFEQHKLVVINPERPPQASPEASDSIDIHFAFNGGQLTGGMETEVAFLLDKHLLDSKKAIYLIKNDSQIIDSLETWSNGLGSFRITPCDTTAHQLMAVMNNGDTLKKSLPDPSRSGILVRTKVDKHSLIYSLQILSGNTTPQTGSHRLKVLTPDLDMLIEKSLVPENGKAKVNIPLKRLQEGLHLMLLEDSDGHPLQVNTAFVPFQHAKKIHLHTESKSYGQRKKIQLQASTQNESLNTPVEGMLTVVRKGTFLSHPRDLPMACIHYPRLTENYLRRLGSLSQEMKNQLDLCSLFWDQKWQKSPQVKQLVKDYRDQPVEPDSLTFMPEARDLTISGTLVNEETGRPIPDTKVIASVLFHNPQVHLYKTRKNGEFAFTLHDLTGSREIFLSPYKRTRDTIQQRLRLQSNFSPRKPDPLRVPFPIDAGKQSFIEELVMNSQLHRHFQDKPIDNSSSPANRVSAIPTEDKISISMSDYIDLETMEQVFLELVPHARIRKDGDQYNFEILTEENFALPGQPLILLDNLPVFDAGKIVKLHPSQIKKIDVINRTYMIGEHAFNGVVMISTNTDHFAGIEFPPSSTFSEYQTLSAPSPFPLYYREGKPGSSGQKNPDFRNLLHWDPNFKVYEDNTSTCFFSSDRTGEYEIIFRGYTSDGQFCYGSKTVVITRN